MKLRIAARFTGSLREKGAAPAASDGSPGWLVSWVGVVEGFIPRTILRLIGRVAVLEQKEGVTDFCGARIEDKMTVGEFVEATASLRLAVF
jgi:hypothetical protein